MQQKIDYSFRPRRSHGFAIVLASVFVSSIFAAGPALAENVLLQVSGQVEIGHGEPPHWTAASDGDKVASNDRVRTGPDGRVEIAMDAGTVRVHENSMLRLPPAGRTADRVELEKGNSLFDVLRRAGRSFEVHTPTVVVSVKGTRFGVDASSEIGEVAVYRGMVGVRAVGVEHAIETLVREGFLATGGAGMPIELDVAPSGDPWASWGDLRREVRDMRQTPRRLRDVDRARASLHRATNVDVLRNAAERKPEVADRLRKHQKEQAARDKMREGKGRADSMTDQKPGLPTVRPGRQPEALPAAPSMGGPEASNNPQLKMMKDRIQHGTDMKRMKTMDMIRTEANLNYEEHLDTQSMTGGAIFLNGQSTLSFENLEGLNPAMLMIVMNSMQDVQLTYQASGTTWTPSDVLINLEAAFISNGMSAPMAASIVNSLISN